MIGVESGSRGAVTVTQISGSSAVWREQQLGGHA